jgi:DNA-binding response OmpR family regulator
MNIQDHVLIVDNDSNFRTDVRQHLEIGGGAVYAVADLEAGMSVVSAGGIDAIIADVDLPDGSGLDLLRAIRTTSSVPVLLLKQHAESAERVLGLDSGADDYLSKPCDVQELVARLHAVLRRSRREPEVLETGDVIKVGELTLSPALRRATCYDKELELTSVEFNLLEHLLRNCGRVVSREELVRVGLGREMGILDRSVDVHLSRLRKKLEQCGSTDEHIKSVRGAGYMLAGLCTSV